MGSEAACEGRAVTNHRGVLRWVLLALAGGAVLVAALLVGDAITGRALVGLPDAGPLTAWALPAVKLFVDAAGTVTVGLTVTAAFLVPASNTEGRIGPTGYRMLRAATWWAAGWAVATVALLVLTLSDILGEPLATIDLGSVLSLAFSVAQGQALVVQAVLAFAVALACRLVLSRTGTAVIAAVACLAVLPPALTGHAAGAGDHQLAVTSLAVHILAAALWVGGLAALLTLRKDSTLEAVARSYSRLALACFVAVAVSGIANAYVRLGTIDQLWSSRYGALVLGKAVALVTVGVIGAVHRQRTLGSASLFRRLATGELVVFAATFGLAVALSRSPTPVPTDPLAPDPLVDLLGFAAPGRISAGSLVWPPLFDFFFLGVTVVGAAAYLAGVRRMRRNGDAWPVARTVSFVAGMVVLLLATCSGFGRYAYVLFSMHMAQHMLLAMVVPILLVGGAPVTLALRVLRASPVEGVRSGRDWLLLVLHSRVLKVFTHPVVALAIYVVSLYGLYFSSALGTLMRYHLGHLVMLTHFVLAGYLFFWVLIGIDPGRRQLPPPMLVLVHFAGMAFHAFLGVVLMQSHTIIALDWYSSVHPAWAASLLNDQKLGAGIAWAFGEIPAAVVMMILVVRWIRDDEREQRRLDRAADRADATGEEDELARYNAFLKASAS